MRPAGVLLFCLSLFGTMGCGAGTAKDDYYRLYDFLFSDAYYKKQIRPAESLNDPLVVTMTFNLLSIVEVDEKQQMLSTSARLQMLWEDDYLSWNSTEYGDIEALLVPQKNVYLPDVVLANSVKAQERIGYDQLPVRLISSGIIDWEPTLHLSTDCDIDITYFPFETQKCDIDFETAVSLSSEIDIDVYSGSSGMVLDDFTKNGQWELVETSAENLSDEDQKTKIRFSIVIKRRRTFYLLNIILPVFFLSLTASLVFALPAEEGEKMGTGITVLLAFAVYLTIVSDLVPNTSLQVSILGLYLTILLGSCALSTIICVFILRIHFRDAERPVGPCTTRIIRFLRRMFCMTKSEDVSENQVHPSVHGSRQSINSERNYPQDRHGMSMKRMPDYENRRMMSPHDDPRISIHSQNSSRQSMTAVRHVAPPLEEITWKLVAETLDTFFFVLFSLVTIVTTLVCLLRLHFGSISDAPALF